MSSVSIRPIRGEDFGPALELWNETRRRDPITARFFKRKILFDVCFDPEGYLLAESDEGLCGYIYVVRRLRALDNDNAPLPTDGWINGFGVLPDAPEGTASLLLAAAEEFAKKHGLGKLSATPYSPFYFTQGFDSKYETHYIDMFKEAGYVPRGESYARDIDLLSWVEPPELRAARAAAEADGFGFGGLTNELLVPFFAYLNTYQSAGWRIRIRELLYDNDDLDRIRIVTYGGEVIGFCIFGDPDGSPERFGPFGVRADFRGRKLGQILLADCLFEMKKRGLHNAWMQWTDKGCNAHYVYEKAGFYISRGHIILDKILASTDN